MDPKKNRPIITLGVGMGLLLVCVFVWIFSMTYKGGKKEKKEENDRQEEQTLITEQEEGRNPLDGQYIPEKGENDSEENDSEDTESVDADDTEAIENNPPQQSEQIAVSQEEIDKLLVTMTIREKVCQMFFVSPEKLTGVGQVTAAGDLTKRAIHRYPVGGILYAPVNLISAEQIKPLLKNAQKYAKNDMFLAIDEEGGDVSTLGSLFKDGPIDPMYSYRAQGTSVAYNNADIIAQNLRRYRFNMNFSPVADVWSDQDSNIVGELAYGSDYYETSRLVGSAVRAYTDRNIICMLKHYPGIGEADGLTTLDSAYIDKKKDELQSQEQMTFETGVEEGADFIMVGHHILTDVDKVPASLSEAVVNGMLREGMHFEGVIITDYLQKRALTAYYSNAEIAVKAVQAGNDMLLEPGNLDGAVEAILEAVKNGTISEERINESVRRILRVKMEHGIIK